MPIECLSHRRLSLYLQFFNDFSLADRTHQIKYFNQARPNYNLHRFDESSIFAIFASVRNVQHNCKVEHVHLNICIDEPLDEHEHVELPSARVYSPFLINPTHEHLPCAGRENHPTINPAHPMEASYERNGSRKSYQSAYLVHRDEIPLTQVMREWRTFYFISPLGR